MLSIIILFILIGLPALVTFIALIGFLFKGRQVVTPFIFRAIEFEAMIVLPFAYGGFNDKNECCDDSALFSPDHQLSIIVLILLCLAAYGYSTFRTKIATPLVEVIVNALLLLGIVLNCFIAIHTTSIWLAIGGNMPIIILTILVLIKNQRLFIEYSQAVSNHAKSKVENFAWKILNLQPILRYPILFIFCLPILIFITCLLLLFGQKPDSFIRAFTDTYQHGFSQWDYKCDTVHCGGHYLCSVAANGHTSIVKPQRLGIRNGNKIICNRQLLVSNAFEDLIQEKFPVLHKFIRNQYNKVGGLIHKYYTVFNNKLIADFIYILMKPMEWFFLLTLYTFDKKPENRIAKQYLSNADRREIDKR